MKAEVRGRRHELVESGRVFEVNRREWPLIEFAGLSAKFAQDFVATTCVHHSAADLFAGCTDP